MFTESASLYDLIYSFKDYKKEAEKIIATIGARMPDCNSILDVGCGTGEHHKYLSDRYEIDGIDLSEEFIQSAKNKNPGLRYQTADMTNFNLNKKYDLILCLFSSIGYVKTIEKLNSTLMRFSEHLKNGGMAIVEPWFTTETWNPRRVHMLTYDKGDIKICRMSESGMNDEFSTIDFHYLLGMPDRGVQHFHERHELGLFSREEMSTAFENAGLEVEFEEKGLIGRGLYFGMKR